MWRPARPLEIAPGLQAAPQCRSGTMQNAARSIARCTRGRAIAVLGLCALAAVLAPMSEARAASASASAKETAELAAQIQGELQSARALADLFRLFERRAEGGKPPAPPPALGAPPASPPPRAGPGARAPASRRPL